MTLRRPAVVFGFLVLAVAACQSPAMTVAPTAAPEVVAPVTASQAIWGEVPKQCA